MKQCISCYQFNHEVHNCDLIKLKINKEQLNIKYAKLNTQNRKRKNRGRISKTKNA